MIYYKTTQNSQQRKSELNTSNRILCTLHYTHLHCATHSVYIFLQRLTYQTLKFITRFTKAQHWTLSTFSCPTLSMIHLDACSHLHLLLPGYHISWVGWKFCTHSSLLPCMLCTPKISLSAHMWNILMKHDIKNKGLPHLPKVLHQKL